VLQSAIVRFQERLELETAEEQMAAELARQAKFAPPPAPPAFEEPPFLAAPPVQQKVEAHKAESAPAQTQRSAETASVPSNLPETPAAAEVVAYRDTETVDEAELAAVLKELEEVESRSVSPEEPVPVAEVAQPVVQQEVAQPVVQKEVAHPVVQEEVAHPVVQEEVAQPVVQEEVAQAVVQLDEVHHVDVVVESTPEPAYAARSYQADDDDDEIFSVTEKPGFSLPIPAIAGAVGLVIVIAVGGWFAMSGSKDPKPSPAQVEVIQEPAPVETAPATTDTIVSSQSEDPNAAAAVATEASQDPNAQKAAAKPKKVEPAKTPEKKKVTVDDLINDN